MRKIGSGMVMAEGMLALGLSHGLPSAAHADIFLRGNQDEPVHAPHAAIKPHYPLQLTAEAIKKGHHSCINWCTQGHTVPPGHALPPPA